LAPYKKYDMRNITFANDEYFHIFNRGVDKQDIFLDDEDFWKFFDGLRDLNNTTYYEDRMNALGLYPRQCKALGALQFKELRSFLAEREKVVEIISYSLNPNHFHLILKQLVDKGVSYLMHKLGWSYTNHFNKKYNHSGHVFQGPFKAVHIDSNNYLLWLAGYVNGNIEIHNLARADSYNWSSYCALCKALGALQSSSSASLSPLSVLGGLDVVLPQFKTVEDFKDMVRTVIQESRTKKEMRDYLLEKI